MMNFDPQYQEQDNQSQGAGWHIEPTTAGEGPLDFAADSESQADLSSNAMAEASIVRMIILGSGGPENAEITEQGLRFIRYLMSKSRSCQYGFLPNLKDIDCIRELAREFIRRCGNASHALHEMYQVI